MSIFSIGYELQDKDGNTKCWAKTHHAELKWELKNSKALSADILLRLISNKDFDELRRYFQIEFRTINGFKFHLTDEEYLRFLVMFLQWTREFCLNSKEFTREMDRFTEKYV